MNNNEIRLEFADKMKQFQDTHYQNTVSKKDKLKDKKLLDEAIDAKRIPLVKIQKLNLEDFSQGIQIKGIPNKIIGITTNKLRFDRKTYLAKAKLQVLLEYRKSNDTDIIKLASTIESVAD